MMSLLWYYRPEHLQGGRSPSMHEVSCLARGTAGWHTHSRVAVGLRHGIWKGQLGNNQGPLHVLGGLASPKHCPNLCSKWE